MVLLLLRQKGNYVTTNIIMHIQPSFVHEVWILYVELQLSEKWSLEDTH